jgi:hypothetical protein
VTEIDPINALQAAMGEPLLVCMPYGYQLIVQRTGSRV